MNNRILKFRVWNGKEFIYYQFIPTLGFVPGTNNIPLNVGEVNAQQYTGLIDKNKKEIYEGDIVRCKGYNGWFDEEGFYYTNTIKFQILPAGETEIAGFLYLPKDREVIGNIYSSPFPLET